ncbi:hypothetical protein [Burkholderia stagnalis]|uniref:hypothetical protein n=1 Tax=Burkholderia stagnalis TaxID=1503054 RepID=UPI001E2EC840
MLISIALIAEDGKEFYAELTDFSVKTCSDFTRAVVLPQLGQFPNRIMARSKAASELKCWMHEISLLPEKPVICYDHPFDTALLIDLIGKRPSGWQLQNISSRIDSSLRDQYFEQHGGRHHALFDARANRSSFR